MVFDLNLYVSEQPCNYGPVWHVYYGCEHLYPDQIEGDIAIGALYSNFAEKLEIMGCFLAPRDEIKTQEYFKTSGIVTILWAST